MNLVLGLEFYALGHEVNAVAMVGAGAEVRGSGRDWISFKPYFATLEHSPRAFIRIRP